MDTISRLTVVWRPAPSVSRTIPVSCTSRPTSRLTKLDLPTPLRPMSTAVVPSGTSARTASTLSGIASDTTSVSTSAPTSARTRSRTRTTASSLSARSALVSTTDTAAPVSWASTSSRSSLRIFTSVEGCVTITRSKLAASTWGTARSVGSFRTSSRERGSTSTMSALSLRSANETRTLSPITARTRSPFTSDVACLQRSSRPSSRRTKGNPRSSLTTHPVATVSSNNSP